MPLKYGARHSIPLSIRLGLSHTTHYVTDKKFKPTNAQRHNTALAESQRTGRLAIQATISRLEQLLNDITIQATNDPYFELEAIWLKQCIARLRATP